MKNIFVSASILVMIRYILLNNIFHTLLGVDIPFWYWYIFLIILIFLILLNISHFDICFCYWYIFLILSSSSLLPKGLTSPTTPHFSTCAHLLTNTFTFLTIIIIAEYPHFHFHHRFSICSHFLTKEPLLLSLSSLFQHTGSIHTNFHFLLSLQFLHIFSTFALSPL